jgi:hypothetical protein
MTVLDVLLDGADIEAREASLVEARRWLMSPRSDNRGLLVGLSSAAQSRRCGRRRRFGLMDRVEQYFAANATPSAAEVTNAYWRACHGG